MRCVSPTYQIFSNQGLQHLFSSSIGVFAALVAPRVILTAPASLSYISVMTENTDIQKNPILLPPAVEDFILKWGDMGGVWGVNRSVAQIHALLYLASAPMTAEGIAETLSIARSNVSNSLKELLAWNLIRRVPVRGDRRDHFEAETDIWEVVTRIAVGRKAREIDPVIAVLRSCAQSAAKDARVTPHARARLNEMLEFTSSVDRWFQQMLSLPRSTLKTMLKLGSRISTLIPVRRT